MANEIRVTATLSAEKSSGKIPTSGADIYALADTASCVVQYAMIEE